jgi:ribosomal protein L11 methyltransferase
LLELCERLSGYVKPGGSIALSGILETQAPAVLAEYSRFFTNLQVATEGPWGLVTGTRLKEEDG